MSIIINRLKDRILKKNKNALILIVGDTGDGKSWSGCSICHEFDPTFDGSSDRVAHMTAKNFIRILRKSGLKRGNAIMWDDIGKGMKPEDWYNLVFKVVVDIIQTFRIRGLLVVFTVPDTTLVTKKLQKLFHYQLETKSIDYKKGIATLKFFEIAVKRTDTKSQNRIFYKFPRVRYSDGKIKVLTKIRVHKPPNDVIKRYEKDKLKEYKKLEAEAEKVVNMIEEKEARKLITDKQIMKDMEENPGRYVTEYNKRTFIDINMIMNDFDIGRNRSHKIKAIKEKDWKRRKII